MLGSDAEKATCLLEVLKELPEEIWNRYLSNRARRNNVTKPGVVEHVRPDVALTFKG